jgi:hypothetical protein
LTGTLGTAELTTDELVGTGQSHLATHLASTLEFVAAHIPYYRDVAGGEGLAIGDFPVVDGALIAERFHEFYQLDSVPDFIATTGGTSGGRSKALLLNYAEMDQAFLARIGEGVALDDAGRFPVGAFPGLAILLSDYQHGFILPPGHGQPVITLPLEVGRHFELVIRMLQDGLVIGGRTMPVTQVFGSITKLRVLTEYCRAQGLSAADFKISTIVSFAFYASQRWSAAISDFWRADVTDAYGLTEFLGAVALRCRCCGGFHMPSIVHAEYLDDEYRAIDGEGAAQLVLTTLLPYRSAMPLVRYATGDIISVLPPCAQHGGRGFHLCGRSNAVLRQASTPRVILLTPFDVMDVVEKLDDMHGDLLVYDEQVGTVMGWGLPPPLPDLSRAGYPRLHCAASGGRMMIAIEVRSTKLADAEALRSDISSMLGDVIRARSPDGSASDDWCEVIILPPGGLAERNLRVTLV